MNNTNLSVKADTLLIYLSIKSDIYLIYLLKPASISILCIKADAILEMEQRDFAREALEYVCLIQVKSYKFLSYFMIKLQNFGVPGFKTNTVHDKNFLKCIFKNWKFLFPSKETYYSVNMFSFFRKYKNGRSLNSLKRYFFIIFHYFYLENYR